jgi:ATP-dependent helicase/nuclease subunit A
LLARLGTEAEDGINALLKQALAYESNAVPSLTGFLAWLESDDLEIKRQIDSASDQIRVMTVHGAKGLEAPIVILPEAGKLQSGNTSDPILPLHGTPAWRIAAQDRPEIMDSAVEDQSEVSAHENLRLLYVGLTRAEKWLIVAASGDLDKGNSWYEMVQTAMQDLNAVKHGDVLRLAHGDWEAGPQRAPAAQTGAAPAVPAHFNQPAPRPQPPAQTLSPSDLGGAKALASERGQDEAAALAHGTQVHRALDILSRHAPQDWPEIEARQNLDPAAAAEARVVLTAPALAQIFAPGTLAEVPLSAKLGSHRIHGIVDRLIVTQDRVLAIDFKTNAAVPAMAQDCPDGILRQMGAYSHALAQIFAGKTIETAIIWTKTAEIMPLPHDIVMQALKSTPYLDEAVTAS